MLCDVVLLEDSRRFVIGMTPLTKYLCFASNLQVFGLALESVVKHLAKVGKNTNQFKVTLPHGRCKNAKYQNRPPLSSCVRHFVGNAIILCAVSNSYARRSLTYEGLKIGLISFREIMH